MPHYKLSVHIPARTGLPRDDSINSYYLFYGTTPTEGQLDTAMGIMASLYTTRPVGHGTAIADYFSADRDPAANHARVDAYLMPATRPGPGEGTGVPVASKQWTWVGYAGSSTPLPDQVAICLSYNSLAPGTTNPKRHRGRVFLGPLNSLSMAETSTGTDAETVSSTARAVITDRAAEVVDELLAASGNPVWKQWSHMDWTGYTIGQFIVDDRYDTQRRRLQRPTVRTVKTIS